MSKFLLSFVILSIGCSSSEFTTKDHQFEDESRDFLRAAMESCNEQFGPIPDMFELVREGKYMDTESFQNFVHCCYSSTGYTNDNGRVIVEKVATLFPEEVLETIKNCDQEYSAAAKENTYNYYKCFQLNSPVNIGI